MIPILKGYHITLVKYSVFIKTWLPEKEGFLKRAAVSPELHQCVTVGQSVSASTNHEGDKTGAMAAGTDAVANRPQLVNKAAAGSEIWGC